MKGLFSQQPKEVIQALVCQSDPGIDESINRGSRRGIPLSPGLGDGPNNHSISRQIRGKSQRLIQDGSGTLKESNSKVLHIVSSTLSQDFTKSSSNQDVGIGQRGVPSAAFGVVNNGQKSSKETFQEEIGHKKQKKSTIVTSKTSSQVQGGHGYPSKGKQTTNDEHFDKEFSNSKQKGAKIENFDNIEAHFASERYSGLDKEFRKEGLINFQGVPSTFSNQKQMTIDGYSKQNLNSMGNDQMNPEDSSKHSKVLKTKRRVTTTITTGKGLNTSGPLLE